MVFPEQQPSTTETHLPPNILGQKDIFIPHLQILLAMGTSAAQNQEYKAVLGEIASWWGGLPQKRPDSADLLAQASGLTITRETLRGAGIARNSRDLTLDGCVVYGDYVLMRSIRPTIRNSFISGFKIGEGLNVLRFHQLHPDPVNALKNGLFESINSPDAEKKLSGFLLFALGCLPEKRGKFVTANPGIIAEYYKRSIGPLRNQLMESLPALSKKKRNGIIDLLNATATNHQGNIAAAAAYEIETLLELLSLGDTYHMEVDNSLLFGDSVLTLVKGGIIRNSILAGNNLLDGAHVRICESYLIDTEGVRLVKDAVLGHPEEYQEIPRFLK